jgi:hypothetical protein
VCPLVFNERVGCGNRSAWKTFLAAHWDSLAAADFFTVEVLTFGSVGVTGLFTSRDWLGV